MAATASDVGIWLYNIHQCGYYAGVRIASDATPIFGGMNQTLNQLSAWSAGKTLGHTCTFTVPEDSDLTEAYLLGMHRGFNGDCLIGIWNRLPGNETNIASVGVGDVVGSASSSISPMDAKRIPGYATYFYLMPSEGKLATIRLKAGSNGKSNFQTYLTSFLSSINPSHIVIDDIASDEDCTVIKGYRRDATAEMEPRAVKAVFQMKSIPMGGDTVFLKAHAEEIQSVIYKTTLSTTSPRDMTWWQNLQDIGRLFAKPAPLRDEFPVKIELPAEFDEASFNATVKAWNEGQEATATGTHDIGFKVPGYGTKWLSRSQARTVLQLSVDWVDNEIVNIPSLFAELERERSAILSIG